MELGQYSTHRRKTWRRRRFSLIFWHGDLIVDDMGMLYPRECALTLNESENYLDDHWAWHHPSVGWVNWSHLGLARVHYPNLDQTKWTWNVHPTKKSKRQRTNVICSQHYQGKEGFAEALGLFRRFDQGDLEWIAPFLMEHAL